MRRVQHSTRTVMQARELAEAGWSQADIVRILGRQGVRVSRSTVACWLDPNQAKAHRERAARSSRRQRAQRLGVSGKLPARSDEAKFVRMQALRDAGLSYTAIALVMGLDFGEQLDSDQARRWLASGQRPRRYTRRQSQEAAA